MGLVEDSRAARAAGLSYGQYVARYGTSPTVQIEPEQEKGKWWYIKKKKEDLVCKCCGGSFRGYPSRDKYCSPECRENAQRNQISKAHRKKRQSRKQDG